MEHHHSRSFHLSHLDRSSTSHSKSKRNIAHCQDNDTGPFWRIFCYTTEMGSGDVVAVEEGEFTRGFDPDL